jgi:AraC-like DNA-binding protein
MFGISQQWRAPDDQYGFRASTKLDIGMPGIDPVFYGLQRRRGLTVLPRHRHECSYAAVILSGGYEEAGDRGRHRVCAGEAVIHGAFEAHLNRYDIDGAEVMNLELPGWIEPAITRVHVPDPGLIVRLAERDAREAAACLLERLNPVAASALDWPDELARDVACNPHLRISHWARDHCLADATVSRGFRQIYGVSPSVYRAHAKARLAWRRLLTQSVSLSEIALDAGFSDQSHMTRGVQALTGRSPGAWRCKVKLIQD